MVPLETLPALQSREWHFVISFREPLKHPQTPPAVRMWGGGWTHKKTPLSYFLPIPNASQLEYRRLAVHDCLQDKEEAS